MKTMKYETDKPEQQKVLKKEFRDKLKLSPGK
jgi:hypothetical protein